MRLAIRKGFAIRNKSVLTNLFFIAISNCTYNYLWVNVYLERKYWLKKLCGEEYKPEMKENLRNDLGWSSFLVQLAYFFSSQIKDLNGLWTKVSGKLSFYLIFFKKEILNYI